MIAINEFWEEWIRQHRERYLRGQVQILLSDGLYRGEISDVYLMGQELVITTNWTAFVPMQELLKLETGQTPSTWREVEPSDAHPDANRFGFVIEPAILSRRYEVHSGRYLLHFADYHASPVHQVHITLCQPSDPTALARPTA